MTALKLADNINIAPTTAKATSAESKRLKFIDPPFPIEIYPEGIQNMLRKLHSEQGYPLDYCCAVLPSFIAGVVGSKVRLKVLGNWKAPLCIWTVIVGESGVMKSPVFDFFKTPFIDIEMRLQNDYEKSKIKYRTELKEFEKQLQFGNDAGVAPIEPQRGDLLIESGTTEGLKKALFANLDVINFYDEFIELFRSFGQYKGGRGTDQTSFLKFFNGDFMKLNLSSRETAFVPFTNTVLVGATQTELLTEIFRGNRDVDGTIFRFNFCFKNLKIPEDINENGISPEIEEYYKNIILQLHNIKRKKDGLDRPQVQIVNWCEDAKNFFLAWRKTYVRGINDSNERVERGVKNKLIGYLPRYALMLEILKRQCENPDKVLDISEICVSLDSSQKAAKVVDYYEYMFSKIQAHVTNNPDKPNAVSNSGVDWLRIFKKDEMLKSGEILKRFKALKPEKAYSISDRSIATLMNLELFKVPGKYSYYMLTNPSED